MIIIGVDVGKQGGVAVLSSTGWHTTEKLNFLRKEDVYNYLVKLLKDIQKKQADREIVFVICQSFGRGKAKYQHNRFYGIVELVAEQNNLFTVFESDNTMRSQYFGKSKGKQQTHDHFKCPTKDESDALLACHWYFKQIKDDNTN